MDEIFDRKEREEGGTRNEPKQTGNVPDWRNDWSYRGGVYPWEYSGSRILWWLHDVERTRQIISLADGKMMGVIEIPHKMDGKDFLKVLFLCTRSAECWPCYWCQFEVLFHDAVLRTES